MKLTEHFKLNEFEMSPTAAALKIINRVPDDLLPNIKRLAEELERVRLAVGGRTIRINSGYRCVALNRAVRGAPKSAHISGLAADIVVPGLTALEVCRLLEVTNCDFEKAIQEGTWTHFQIPEVPGTGKRILMTAHFDKNGIATYSAGV